mgnify:CR=1 FL=1
MCTLVCVDLSLTQPSLLPAQAWSPIEIQLERLRLAVQFTDGSLAIGTAKELVETVSRVVLDSSSSGPPQPSATTDFDPLTVKAHEALKRRANKEDLTADSRVAEIANSARKMVSKGNEIRNTHGTGHGRVEPPGVAAEMIQLVVGAALLWCRWALVRLNNLLAQEPESLLQKVRYEVPHTSTWAQLLQQIDLPNQPTDVQHSIGEAFGARAARDTFVARTVGIQPAITSDDLGLWPTDYRFGIVDGLTFTSDGALQLTPRRAPLLWEVLRPVPDSQAKTFLRDLTIKAHHAPSLLDPPDQSDLAKALRTEGPRHDPGHVEEWRALADIVDPEPQSADELPHWVTTGSTATTFPGA